ncbi:MAG TPA: hypothetical protein VK964_10215 [Nocardioidaceae bacterium]|nr:hypothetical protein [Nocardioidaceae bacterium]
MNEQDAQEQVRRLLAAAGSSPPDTPEDVATRLDDVLAGLVAERTASSGPAAATDPGTTDLAGHAAVDEEPGAVIPLETRRRRWPQLLVAAAAASVVALGVGNLAFDGGQDADQAVTAEAGSAQDGSGSPLLSEPGEDNAADRDEAPGTTARDSGEQAPEALSRRSDELDAASLPARPVRLRTDSLPRDVQLVEDLSIAAPVSEGGWESACVRPSAGASDEWVAVRLDGERAVLVLRASTGGRRTADVFSCDDAGTPVASVTVRAR